MLFHTTACTCHMTWDPLHCVMLCAPTTTSNCENPVFYKNTLEHYSNCTIYTHTACFNPISNAYSITDFTSLPSVPHTHTLTLQACPLHRRDSSEQSQNTTRTSSERTRPSDSVACPSPQETLHLRECKDPFQNENSKSM